MKDRRTGRISNQGLLKNALNVASAGLSFTYNLINFVHIRFHIGSSVTVDGDLCNHGDDPTIVNFGLALQMEFYT
jgi:hypothetical protein